MGKDQLQPSIHVDDEILILRKDISEKPKKQREPYCTMSQQMLTESPRVMANPDIFATKLTIPRFGTCVQRQKVNFRSRPRNQTSTDPRLKCERFSGNQNDVTCTHSDTRLTLISALSPRKHKIHSNPVFPIKEDKEVIVIPKKTVITTIDDTCKLQNQDRNSEVVPYVEQSTITEKMAPEIIDDKSAYETPSDISDEKSQIGDFHRNSPILFKNYACLLKPAHVKRSRSSWTLPITNNSKFSPVPVCPHCSQAIIPININTDDVKKLVAYKKKSDILTTVLGNYCKRALLLFGVVCGLVLLALCGWVITNEAMWILLSTNKEVLAKPTGFKGFLMYLGGGLLHGINTILTLIYNLLVMPRNKLLGSANKEKGFWYFS